MSDRVTRYPFFQEAYFVNDLDVSIRQWSELYGAGPFRKAMHHQTDRFHYRGTNQEADVSYAFGYLGDMMIQFIAQHDETPSIYRDMYAAGQEGFHHVAILVHNFEAEYQRMCDKGFVDACRLYADGVDAAYFDTRSVNGCFTELHGDPQPILGRWAALKRAHDLWRPGDSPYIELPRIL